MALLGYLPASFRGVPFHVDDEGEEGGRRLAVHDLAGAEVPVVEDMGRAAKKWTVRAYVSGALWSVNSAALAAALDAPGPALLMLPWRGPVLAVVEAGWSMSRVKERHGIVEFDITFVEAGLASTPFGLPPALNVIGALFVIAIGLIAAAVSDADESADGRQRCASSTEAFRLRLNGAGDPGGIYAARVDDLRGASPLLSSAAVVEDAGTLVRSMARDADPSDAASAALPLALAFGAGGPLPAELFGLLPEADDGTSAVPAPDDATAEDAAAAALYLVASAMGAAAASYQTRPDAVQAREDLSAALDACLPTIARLGSAALESVTTAVYSATDYLSREAGARAPLVRVETGVSLPSTLLAWKLYGDPEQAAALVGRAGTGTPLLMPTVIEAPAPTVPTGG